MCLFRVRCLVCNCLFCFLIDLLLLGFNSDVLVLLVMAFVTIMDLSKLFC